MVPTMAPTRSYRRVMAVTVEDSALGPGSDPTLLDAPAERHASWFRLEYPRIVGLVRRVIDPQHSSTASLEVAESIATGAFARACTPGKDPAQDGTDRAEVICRVLDQCVERLTGHPGTVPLHYELLGPDIDFDGDLPLSELHDALSGLRRGDRRAGLLGFAAGASPSEVASLLDRPLDETIERLGRVATRLADGRRVGLVDVQGFDPS